MNRPWEVIAEYDDKPCVWGSRPEPRGLATPVMPAEAAREGKINSNDEG